jgi:hypothetical protein
MSNCDQVRTHWQPTRNAFHAMPYVWECCRAWFYTFCLCTSHIVPCTLIKALIDASWSCIRLPIYQCPFLRPFHHTHAIQVLAYYGFVELNWQSLGRSLSRSLSLRLNSRDNGWVIPFLKVGRRRWMSMSSVGCLVFENLQRECVWNSEARERSSSLLAEELTAE